MDRLRRTQSRRDLRGLRGLGTTSRIVVRHEAPPPSPEQDSSDNFEPFQVVKLSKIARPEPDYDPKPHPVMWMAPPFHPKRDMCNLQYRYSDWPENKTRVLLLNYPMPILHGYCPTITANVLPEAYPHFITYNPNRRLREFTLTTASHNDARNILNLLRGHAEDGISLDRFSETVNQKRSPYKVAERALRAARDVGIPVLEEFFEEKLMLAGEGFVQVDGEEAKMAEAEDMGSEGDKDGDGWELL